MQSCPCPQCNGLDEAPFRICEKCEENMEWCDCEYREQQCDAGDHCDHDSCRADLTCCWCGEEYEYDPFTAFMK